MEYPESFEQFIKKNNNSNVDSIPDMQEQPMFSDAVQYPVQQYPQRQHQQQMGMQPMQDPFMTDAYRNINLPNVPLNYGGNMADSLINNNEIPEDIQKRWWPFIHKDNLLSFQDDITKQEKLVNFDIVKVDILTTTPYYDYNFEKELEFNSMRHIIDTKLDRAKGFSNKGKPFNERIALQSQFSENRNINENSDSDIKQGFFRRLLSRK